MLEVCLTTKLMIQRRKNIKMWQTWRWKNQGVRVCFLNCIFLRLHYKYILDSFNIYDNNLTNFFNEIYFSEYIQNTSLHFPGFISTTVNVMHLSQVNSIITTYHGGNTTEPPLGNMLPRNTALNLNYILYTEYVIF